MFLDIKPFLDQFNDKFIDYLKIKLDKNEYFLVENATLIWNFIENYFEKDENKNKNEINKIIQIFIECKKLDESKFSNFILIFFLS